MKSEMTSNNDPNSLTPNIPQEDALFLFSKAKQQNKNKSGLVMPSGLGKTWFSAFETYGYDGII